MPYVRRAILLIGWLVAVNLHPTPASVCGQEFHMPIEALALVRPVDLGISKPYYLLPSTQPDTVVIDNLFANDLDDSNGTNRSNGNGESRRPGPNVPEPMVFDLIRPLGVRRGELEANVLGFVPFRRTRTRVPQFNFITGADQSTKLRPAFEWAPEVEFGLFDNFALEFELPMAEGRVEAYKAAAQYTFGTAFNEQFIHVVQGILFVDRSNGAVTPTLLYIAALRFDPTYSLLTIIGYNHEFGGDNPEAPLRYYSTLPSSPS